MLGELHRSIPILSHFHCLDNVTLVFGVSKVTITSTSQLMESQSKYKLEEENSTRCINHQISTKNYF